MSRFKVNIKSSFSFRHVEFGVPSRHPGGEAKKTNESTSSGQKVNLKMYALESPVFRWYLNHGTSQILSGRSVDRKERV